MRFIADKPRIQLNTAVHLRFPTSPPVPREGSRLFEYIATTTEIVGDFAAVTLAVVLSYWIYALVDVGRHIRYQFSLVMLAAVLFGILIVLMLDREGAYREGNGLLRIKETECVLRVSTRAFLLAFPVSIFAAHLISRLTLAIAFILVPLLVISEKQLCFMLIRALHARGFKARNVLIYGAGDTGRRVFSALKRSPKVGLSPVALVDDNPDVAGEVVYASGYRREVSAPVLAGPVTAQMIKDLGVGTVIIAIPALARERFGAVLSEAEKAKARVAYVPEELVSRAWVDYVDIDGLMLASFGEPAPKRVYELCKRILDLVTASVLALFCSPVLLMSALAIRIDSSGPILFRQTRVGKDGKLFSIYKFRTMRVDAPAYSFSPKESQDPRITRIGRYLRKTSLDELPQLFNVIKGEMSLVGPRPEMLFIVEQYGPRERQRLCVVPGITGLWQLSADRAFLIHENLQYDLYYIRNRGLFIDLAILLHTAVFAMRGV